MFNSNDKAMINGLNKLLEDATFPLKKREVAAFAKVMTWIKELEEKIDKDIKDSHE